MSERDINSFGTEELFSTLNPRDSDLDTLFDSGMQENIEFP